MSDREQIKRDSFAFPDGDGWCDVLIFILRSSIVVVVVEVADKDAVVAGRIRPAARADHLRAATILAACQTHDAIPDLLALEQGLEFFGDGIHRRSLHPPVSSRCGVRFRGTVLATPEMCLTISDKCAGLGGWRKRAVVTVAASHALSGGQGWHAHR
jgi:hypothetical protein